MCCFERRAAAQLIIAIAKLSRHDVWVNVTWQPRSRFRSWLLDGYLYTLVTMPSPFEPVSQRLA